MISITLPYPPSLNTYWRSVVIKRRVRVLISEDGRAYRRRVSECVMLARAAGSFPRSVAFGRLVVRIEAQPPDRRVRDLDNLLKALLDAMTEAGAWSDDSLIDELTVVRLAPVRDGQIRVLFQQAEGVRAA